MADLSYDVQVNSTPAERNLAKLQQSVGGLNATFLRFRETIATISLGAVISSSLRFADAVQDLSDATGIATANILGFSNAVSENGGSAEGAQKGILKLVNAIGEAAEGSEETQKAFKSVGVTLNDLRTLSEQDILEKTIKGLDAITNSAQRSALITQLLGKEFRNVKFGGLADAYRTSRIESEKYSGSIAAGAAAQQNLEVTIRKFQTALLEVLRPINEFVSKLDISIESIKQIIKTVASLGIALFALTKGLAIINSLSTAYGRLAGSGSALAHNVNMIGASFFGFFKNIGRAVGILDSSKNSLQLVGFAVASLARSLLRFAGLAGLIYTIVEAFSYLEKSVFQTNYIEKGVNAIAIGLEHLTRAAGDLLNLPTNLIGRILGIDNAVGLGTPLLALAEKAAQARKDAEAAAQRGSGQGRGDPKEIANREAADKAAKDRAKELREVRDKAAEREMERIRKFNAALTGQQQAYVQLNTEAQTFSNYLSGDLKFQTSLLGMTEDQKEIATALNAETQRYLQQQNQLQSKLSEVQSEIGIELASQKFLKDDDLAASKDKVELLTDEEKKLKKLSETYYALHMSNGRAIEDELKKQQLIKNTEAERVSNLEYIGDRLREQAASYETLGGALRDINDKRVSIGFETNQRGVGPLARQFAEIQESARTAALEAGRAFAATFESEDGLTAERAEELAAGLQSIAEGYRGIAAAQTEVLTNSQTFASGLAETFAAYAESANNAASQAKTYFETFTGGMEDALVKFVQTGKLSFKDLANSLIADLIRIQTRKIITGLFGGGGGGGILGGLFGGLFGGGSTKAGAAVLGLPGYANGGNIPAGQLSVVGERGPELFMPQSAGKIIPNTALGGTTMQNLTTVNYSIQAVDASSFRALVARDPQFIYSVTEKGRRSQPTRSR
jgi:lambda family phage tail tape measure protein